MAATSRRQIRHAHPTMGTVVSFDLRFDGIAETGARAALGHACDALSEADRVFSLWKPNSPMSRFRRGELELADAPAALAEAVARCRSAREDSAGWFDPWAMPGGFDPTGLIKGWAAQQALEALVDGGIGAAMVNAGGDVATHGEPAPGRRWRLGIRDPQASDRVSCVVAVDGGLATSGSYERGAHIVDPHTGEAASSLLSASVAGPDLALADALATALYAAGPPGLEMVGSVAGYRGMTIDAKGRIEAGPGFPCAAP